MTLACVDETNGATDTDGDGCDYYESHQNQCGDFDNDDFIAKSMCCACKTTGNFEMMKCTTYIYCHYYYYYY